MRGIRLGVNMDIVAVPKCTIELLFILQNISRDNIMDYVIPRFILWKSSVTYTEKQMERNNIMVLKFGKGQILLGSIDYMGNPTQTFYPTDEEHPIGKLAKPIPMSELPPVLMMSFENIESLNTVIGSLEKLKLKFKENNNDTMPEM